MALFHAETEQAMPQEFYKCGEITTSVNVGKKIFALNCIFCTTICLQLETFATHIEEEHGAQIYYDACDVEEEYASTGVNTSENYCSSLSQENNEQSTNFHEDEKFSNAVESNCDCSVEFEDPLLEIPMSVNQEPSSMCIVHVKQEDDFNESPAVDIGRTKDEQDSNEDKNMDEPCGDLANFDKNESSASSSDFEMDTDNEVDDDDSDNRDFLLVLISGYEKHSILWDPNNPMAKNRKKQDEAIKKIAQTVKKKTNVTISTKSIKERIKKMRYKFRSELQNKKLAEERNEDYTQSWYFEKLKFLNKTITYKPRNKRGAKALANEKPALPLPNLTEVQTLELIEIYKSFPCLWDMQHIGFRFKTQRNEALDEMIQAVKNKIKLNMTHEELQKKLYRIRYACTQEKHRKLQCERTQREFKPSSKYFERISFLEDNVGPFKCHFCDEIFNGADQYRIHKSKHDGSMPFICPICNRGFMKVGNCTVHVRRHTRDYPFECKVCGKRFATSTDVNVHMRYHTGEKPYFCEVCGQSFRTWSFFDAHMRRHQKRPSHKCTICSKAFYENNKLTEHMKAHLNVRDKVCNICGKAFTSSKYLRQHKQIHAEKKKYVCKICSKDFAQYAGLSGHMKSHGTTVSGGAAIEDNH